MANKNDLLQFCRYYKGEKEFPSSLSRTSDMAFLFWEAEQKYVENDDVDFEANVVQQYFDAGLAGAALDLPLFLSACLFVVYNKHSDCDLYVSAAYFVRDFLPAYLGLTIM